jgi:hypothetical protein
MYWKMSTDLSRPLVTSMGAHDPLEGLICTISAMKAAPPMEAELQPLKEDFQEICAGREWSTDDALGIGGLLLDTLRVCILTEAKAALPASVQPQKLWGDSLHSLENFASQHSPRMSATQRLPFRECGLTLGLRALHGGKSFPEKAGLNLDPLDPYLSLAATIENFWLDSKNQRASTWTGHLDINAVTLAASLVAGKAPLVFE